MRLTELHPKWITLNGWADDRPFYVGITFRCPHCPDGERGYVQYLAVFFENPIDPHGLVGSMFALPRLKDTLWYRTGDTFETLCLTPSVDASKVGHWHGSISCGEVS